MVSPRTTQRTLMHVHTPCLVVHGAQCAPRMVLSCLSSADADGFVKVLADKGTDRLLGAHIIGTVSGWGWDG